MSSVFNQAFWTTESTSNPFARLLSVYEVYKRSHLVPSGLEKIAKKYKTKSDLLLQDVSKKYPDFIVPSAVPVVEVVRMVEVYSVPDSYIAACGAEISERISSRAIVYDIALDVRSESFDPLRALQEQRIFASMLNIPGLDNLSKAQSLLPAPSGKVKTLEQIKAEAAQALQSRADARAAGAHSIVVESRKPIITQISIDSSQERLSSGATLDSPLALMLGFMNAREKVTVVIRGRNHIRGFIHGFIRGFDKHFNLALTDADEERLKLQSIDNESEVASADHGLPLSKRRVVVSKRHLPQVLLRGDNIVSVYRFKKS